jgi:GH24 family phage-related lysozyme (muramidase)
MITEQSFDYEVPYQKVFNTGSGFSEHSILLKVLNAGDNTVVPSQLLRWVYRGCSWLIPSFPRTAKNRTLQCLHVI